MENGIILNNICISSKLQQRETIVNLLQFNAPQDLSAVETIRLSLRFVIFHCNSWWVDRKCFHNPITWAMAPNHRHTVQSESVRNVSAIHSTNCCQSKANERKRKAPTNQFLSLFIELWWWYINQPIVISSPTGMPSQWRVNNFLALFTNYEAVINRFVIDRASRTVLQIYYSHSHHKSFFFSHFFSIPLLFIVPIRTVYCYSRAFFWYILR